MSAEPMIPEEDEPSRSWLFDHIGRLAGLVLAAIALGFIALLAFLGFRPAEGVLVFVVAGLLMIGIGGRLHGL